MSTSIFGKAMITIVAGVLALVFIFLPAGDLAVYAEDSDNTTLKETRLGILIEILEKSKAAGYEEEEPAWEWGSTSPINPDDPDGSGPLPDDPAEIKYADWLSEDAKRYNTEIYAMATNYSRQTRYPGVETALRAFLLATPNEENAFYPTDPNKERIVYGPATIQLYKNNPDILKQLTKTNFESLGLKALHPKWVQVSSDGNETIGGYQIAARYWHSEPGGFLTQLIYEGDPQIAYGPYNFYAQMNVSAGIKDHIIASMKHRSEYISDSNIYFKLLILGSMHQLPGPYLERRNFNNHEHTVNEDFYYRFFKKVSDEKYLAIIREAIKGKMAMFDMDYNALTIQVINAVQADIKINDPSFFSQNGCGLECQNLDSAPFKPCNGSIHFDNNSGYCGILLRAPIKMLISYMIVEQRYSGAW